MTTTELDLPTMPPREHFELWVPIGHLHGLDSACPVIACPGQVDGDTFWATVFTEEPEVLEFPVPLAETLDRAPTVLILELGALENEDAVTTACDAVEAELHTVFGECGGDIDREKCRTTAELRCFMSKHRNAGLWTHIIVVGHGGPEGVGFINHEDPEGPPIAVGGTELADLLGCEWGCGDTQIISLCCDSGCVTAVGALSRAANITEVIAPLDKFPISYAGPFVNLYFQRLYRSAAGRVAAVEEASMCCEFLPMAIWRDGIPILNETMAA